MCIDKACIKDCVSACGAHCPALCPGKVGGETETQGDQSSFGTASIPSKSWWRQSRSSCSARGRHGIRRGGARDGNRRCSRICRATRSSQIAATILVAPPHRALVKMSIANVRRKSSGQAPVTGRCFWADQIVITRIERSGLRRASRHGEVRRQSSAVSSRKTLCPNWRADGALDDGHVVPPSGGVAQSHLGSTA